MLKGGHKKTQPFNIRKMASYFKDQEVIVHETDDSLLIADRFSIFQVGLYETIANSYRSGIAQKHKNYKLVGGQFLESTSNIMNPPAFWKLYTECQAYTVVHPT